MHLTISFLFLMAYFVCVTKNEWKLIFKQLKITDAAPGSCRYSNRTFMISRIDLEFIDYTQFFSKFVHKYIFFNFRSQNRVGTVWICSICTFNWYHKFYHLQIFFVYISAYSTTTQKRLDRFSWRLIRREHMVADMIVFMT